VIRELARLVLPKSIRHPLGVGYSLARQAGAAARFDAINIRTYGRRAPRYGERVWIDPMACDWIIGGLKRSQTGQVLSGEWDSEKAPLATSVKIQACELHWQRGVPWEETGVYEHMMQLIREHGKVDGCLTLADVRARYSRLDAMYDQILSEGQLRSQVELRGWRNFRALGEIYVHFDRNGQILFGGGGTHRFAASRIAGLSSVPAQLGVVHAEALDRWTLNAIRSSQRPQDRI
jgi:hypothetical protein